MEMSRLDRLELAVDERLLQLREEMRDYDSQEWTTAVVAAFMRAAWAKGVMDGLAQPKEMRSLIRSLGYRVPK